jgi:hypothetical protein
MSEMCYKKAVHDAYPLRSQLWDIISETDPKAWVSYYNFEALPVPMELIDDPLLVRLEEKRDFQCGLLKIPPHTVYNWHVDTDRNCGLNMLVYDDGQSKCIFAPEGLKIVMPAVELRYAPNTFYAFNTKVMHTVINFTTPRYMFSLEFIGKDYGLTYAELLADLKELGYGS